MAQVGITSDIFRCGALGLATVSENTHWIAGIVRPALAPAFSGRRIILSRSDGGQVDVKALAQELGLPTSPETWARLSLGAGMDEAIARILAPVFDDVSHVIGFGLPPGMMRFLDRAGIAFLDLEIAQLRLSPQLRFRARTNDPGLQETLQALQHPLGEHVTHVQTALSGRAANDASQGVKRGVFLGQKQLDLALVEQGRLRCPHDPDLLEQLKRLTGDLDELHILPHPESRNRVGHLLPLIEALPNAVIGGSNSYAMLAHPDTVRAIGLSSSSLREAALLGVEAKALILPDRDNPACLPATLTDWVEVDDALFSPEVLAGFAAGEGLPSPARQGAGLIEARMGVSQRTLAKAAPIRQLPQLQPGRSFALGTQAGAALECLQFGWSQPEPWGIWSEGQTAALAFRCTTEAPCRLILEGRLFHHRVTDYTVRPDVEARVCANGQACPVTLQITEQNWQAVVDLPDGLTDAPIFVHFLITGACAPSLLALAPDGRKLGIGLHGIEIAQAAHDSQVQMQDAAYYNRAHREIEGYYVNNWMVPFARALRALDLDSMIECACGNGEFAEQMAPHMSTYYAMDWAASPLLPYSTKGFHHLHWDAYTDALPQADLLCSADFLEHLREAELDAVLGRMLSAAPRQFHVIACYDDFHSHLTIETPEWWLDRLRRISQKHGLPADWQLLDWVHRNPERPVATVCNFASELPF